MYSNPLRLLRLSALILFVTAVVACSKDAPTALVVTATPGPVGISVGEVTSDAPVIGVSSVTPFTPNPQSTSIPAATAVPFKALTVCLPIEPPTLYEYARLDRDNAWARSVILETMRDGPIDHRNFEYQPILIEKLPSLSDGDAALKPVTIREGETFVDALGNIAILTPNAHYFDKAGVEQVYAGGGSIETMQMSVTFKLKAGLTWEDGEPLTADDILFAWQIAKDPASTGADPFISNRMLDPVVTDPRTITFTYLPGFKDNLFYARLPVPLPRHRYGQLTASQLAADENANRRPVSFGPFIIQEWAPGDHLTVGKNPRYYRAAEGLPVLNQIIFRFVPDAGEMITMALNGECQVSLASQDSFFTPYADAIEQVETQGTFRVISVPSTTFEHLDFNISPVSTYRGVASTGLFQDVRVRQAFAYCINRRELVDKLIGGRGDIPAGYVPANHPYFNTRGIAFYPFDPAKGRSLLEEAGWRDTNGDGIVDKNGRLSLDYVYGPTDNALRASIAEILEQQLKDNCGIEVNPDELIRGDLFGDFPDGAVFGRQYDLAQFSWVGGETEPSCSLYTSVEWTGLGDGEPDQYGLTGSPGGGNSVGYINPDFDSACLTALNTLDSNQKRAYHQEALTIFTQDVPSLVLFYKPKLSLVRPTVFDFSLDTTQDSVLWNAETIDLLPPPPAP